MQYAGEEKEKEIEGESGDRDRFVFLGFGFGKRGRKQESGREYRDQFRIAGAGNPPEALTWSASLHKRRIISRVYVEREKENKIGNKNSKKIK